MCHRRCGDSVATQSDCCSYGVATCPNDTKQTENCYPQPLAAKRGSTFSLSSPKSSAVSFLHFAKAPPRGWREFHRKATQYSSFVSNSGTVLSFTFPECVFVSVCTPPPFQILIHPGVVMDEIHVVEAASRGGPLGELVQWSDLIATLHILGHHLHLSASISDVKT